MVIVCLYLCRVATVRENTHSYGSETRTETSTRDILQRYTAYLKAVPAYREPCAD